MSGTTKLKAIGWVSAPLAPEETERHLQAARSRFDEIQRIGRAYRRGGTIVGATGCAIGVAGLLCAATLFPLKTVENRWFAVDRVTGVVGEVAGARDAPRLFGEQVAEQYLRAYVEARESYVADTADLMFHRVAIMSAPAEQQAYAAWFSPHSNPQSPQTVYARGSTVRVENFRFSRFPGAGKENTFVYQVRFDRVEIIGGHPGPPQPWIATVQFQWHPELAMSHDDRTLNPAGMQVLAYASQSEVAR